MKIFSAYVWQPGRKLLLTRIRSKLCTRYNTNKRKTLYLYIVSSHTAKVLRNSCILDMDTLSVFVLAVM